MAAENARIEEEARELVKRRPYGAVVVPLICSRKPPRCHQPRQLKNHPRSGMRSARRSGQPHFVSSATGLAIVLADLDLEDPSW